MKVTTSAPARFSGRWPMLAWYDARGTERYERARGLDVASGRAMAHRLQHGCDGAHASPAGADHVNVNRPAEVDLRCHQGAHAPTFATDSARAATRSAASL